MTLRARLTLTVLVVAVPLVLGIAWLKGDLQRRSVDRALHEFAVARMESGGRERCEADPSFFAISTSPDAPKVRGVAPPPPPEGGLPPVPTDGGAPVDVPRAGTASPITQMWAYRDDFKSANPRAPEMPAELAEMLRSGAADAGTAFEQSGLPGRQLAVRMPWTGGPGAFALVRRIDPAPLDYASFPIWAAAGLALVIVLVVAVAAGSVVRRIRRLTDEMSRSAASRYERPVDAAGGDEIAALARSFNAAGAEVRSHIATVEAREEAQRTFLANTTHDVMTPLTVLQGHLAAMRRRAAEGKAVDVEVANAAVEQAYYLASLVHNLSAVAKLEAGPQQVHLAPVDLNDLVQRVVERHWAVASPRAIEVHFAVPEKPVWIDADSTLFEQALMNVVGNAVRYNHAGGHVAVLLDEIGAAEFSLRVVDDGPGVDDAQLARLTERAFRTDEARRRNPEGSGLGLDIARRVASFHRIALSLRRSEHNGLEVEFKGSRGIPPA